jgi:ABC-2 type transport system permease protein
MIPLAHRRSLLGDLAELVSSHQVLHELVKRDLKVRYKRSVLGQVWTMLNPLLMMAVTTVVFSSFFRFAITNFPIYMLSAYVLWGFFSQGTLTAATSVLSSGGLTRKVYLPPALFPLAAVCSAAITMLLSLVPLCLLLVITGGEIGWPVVFLPVALGLATVFTCGVALLLAAASVFFHDTIHMYQVVLLAWMYLTPIFYPIDIVPSEWSFVVHLNPLFHLVQIFRDPIYAGSWPDPANVAAATAYALGAAALGWWYFERSRDKFVSYL